MSDHRRAVAVWASAVCVGAAALAGFLQHLRWLFIPAVAIGGLAFLILLVSGMPDLLGWLREHRDEAIRLRTIPGPAFTDRWRQTTEGMEVGNLMHTFQKRLSHPGYSRPPGGEPPAVRIGLLVACDPLRDTPSTAELRDAFLGLLEGSPIRDLVGQLTHVSCDLSWRSYDSNGRITNGAVLASDGEEKAPVASALMNLNEADTRRWGQDPRCAELLLHIEPRGESGGPARPADLGKWHDRLVTALEVAGTFARFLSSQIGVQTHPEPPTRLGVRLDAHPSIAELVDVHDLVPVPGSSISASFLSYVIAERGGQPPKKVAAEVLRVWCDHALHVEGYDGQLARLLPSDTVVDQERRSGGN